MPPRRRSQQRSTVAPTAITAEEAFKQQRFYDVRWAALISAQNITGAIYSKYLTGTVWENIQRSLGIAVPSVLALWCLKADDASYRRWRVYMILPLRLGLFILPGYRGAPWSFITRLKRVPENTWLAKFVIEPLQFLIGSGIFMLSFWSIVPLPLWLTFIVQATGMLLIRNNMALCQTELVSSSTYASRISTFNEFMNEFAFIVKVVWSSAFLLMNFSVPPPLSNPLDQCQAFATFLQLTLVVLAPIGLTLWMAPPVVVWSCRHNVVDRFIVKVATFFIWPYQSLLTAAGIDPETGVSPPLMRFLCLCVLIALCWHISMIWM